MVANTHGGTNVTIGFYRNGQQQSATATIERLDVEGSESSHEAGAAAGFGLSLGDLTPELANQLRVPNGTQGAVVENVEPFTPASSAGLRRGDVILEVNRQPIRSARDAARALGGIKSGDVAFVLVSRSGVQQLIELRKE